MQRYLQFLESGWNRFRQELAQDGLGTQPAEMKAAFEHFRELHRLCPPDARRHLRLAGEQPRCIVADFTTLHSGSNARAHDSADGRSRDGNRPDPQFVQGYYDMDMCKPARASASQR